MALPRPLGLSLAPYGTSLMSGSVATWLAIARVQLSLLCLFVSYGYSRAILSISSQHAYTVAFAVAASSFLLTWSIGALLITLDFAAYRSPREPLERRILLPIGVVVRVTLLTLLLAPASIAVAKSVPDVFVRPFAAALLLTVVMAKLFQPRSVTIYYSEALQDAYRRFLAGGFHGLLPDPDHDSLSPLSFADWYGSAYQALLSEDRLRRESETATLMREHEEVSRQRVAEADDFSRHQMQALQEAVGEALDATRQPVRRTHA